jgi:hypothetical protein
VFNSRLAGHPSITAPTAFPWLDPKLVTENIFPIVFAIVVSPIKILYS